MNGHVWHQLLWLNLVHAENVPQRLQGLLTLQGRVGWLPGVQTAPDLLKHLAAHVSSGAARVPVWGAGDRVRLWVPCLTYAAGRINAHMHWSFVVERQWTLHNSLLLKAFAVHTWGGQQCCTCKGPSCAGQPAETLA